MICLQLAIRAPDSGPAVHTLHALTPQASLELEHAVAGMLGSLRRDLLGAAPAAAPQGAVPRPDAAEVEYASWMPDPGAIEVASWAAHMRTAVR